MSSAPPPAASAPPAAAGVHSWSASIAQVPGVRVPVSVEPYSSEWASRYSEESARIRVAFGDDNLVGTHHVGSTSVPQCAAKPVIDILVLVRDWEDTWATQLEQQLREMDYHAYPREHPFTKIKRRYWQKVVTDAQGKEKHVAHLHVMSASHPDAVRLRAFPAWLMSHPDDVADYSQAKLSAAEQLQSAGPEVDVRRVYNSLKEPVVKRILAAMAAAESAPPAGTDPTPASADASVASVQQKP